jgi:hypothetical protein
MTSVSVLPSNSYPSVERVRTLFDYVPELGWLVWRVSRSHVRAGERACNLNPRNGYRRIKVDGRRLLEHRLVWIHVKGFTPGEFQIDHINRIRDDNRISNLQLATSLDQRINAGLSSNNTSGIRGLHRDRNRGKWQARIQIRGKFKHLGYFDNIDDAIAARQIAERKYFGAICQL